MSNSPMRGVTGHPAGACRTMYCAEIQRIRDALRSYLAVLEEARRQLDDAAAAAATDESSAIAGDDDFYPLDDGNEELEERSMQWQDQVCRQMVYNNSSRHLRQDDGDLVGRRRHLADSGNHDFINLDDLNDDDDRGDEISRDIVALGLHVPHIDTATATPPPFMPDEEAADGGRGFGAVPASAEAIAGLRKHTYVDGSAGGDDSMCVICMEDYKKGTRLRVMPCTYKHRFHGSCIREWLSLSNLCPLCRHALPTAPQGGGSGGVHRRVVVRVNVNPY